MNRLECFSLLLRGQNILLFSLKELLFEVLVEQFYHILLLILVNTESLNTILHHLFELDVSFGSNILHDAFDIYLASYLLACGHEFNRTNISGLLRLIFDLGRLCLDNLYVRVS